MLMFTTISSQKRKNGTFGTINESFIKDTPYHFFSEDELRELLKDFRDIDLNYVTITRNNMNIKMQNWIAIAKK